MAKNLIPFSGFDKRRQTVFHDLRLRSTEEEEPHLHLQYEKRFISAQGCNQVKSV